MCGSELSREEPPTVNVNDKQAELLSSLKDHDLPVILTLDSEESCETPPKKKEA